MITTDARCLTCGQLYTHDIGGGRFVMYPHTDSHPFVPAPSTTNAVEVRASREALVAWSGYLTSPQRPRFLRDLSTHEAAIVARERERYEALIAEARLDGQWSRYSDALARIEALEAALGTARTLLAHIPAEFGDFKDDMEATWDHSATCDFWALVVAARTALDKQAES